MFNFDSPYGMSIFCDDVRHEVGGKSSFIGVYQGALYANSFPITIAKFGIVAIFNEPKEMAKSRDFPISIQIFIPGNDEPVVVGELQPLTESDFENITKSQLPDDPDLLPNLVTLKAEFMLSPLTIEKTGRIKVRVRYGDDIIKLGSLRVEFPPGTPNLSSIVP